MGNNSQIDWKQGSELLGSYTVERKLGQGGMGAVYLVRRRMDGQRFAVKTILTSDLGSTQSRHTFLRELRTWVDFPDYPHLTRCCFFRTVRDRLAIFSEFVDGGSLKDWINAKKLLDYSDILDVAIQLAWGLQAVHDCQVIHRDVKPANVLLTNDRVVKVTDFGLSKLQPLSNDVNFQSQMVSSGSMTAAYCSPEQALSGRLNRKTDIWSYGITILEMFTGPPTWMLGVAAPYILENIISGKQKHPYPVMRDELADILRGCFQRDPANRWQSMKDIADALMVLYRKETGSDYPREKPGLPLNESSPLKKYERKLLELAVWDDPFTWTDRVSNLTGLDCSKVEKLKFEQAGSHKTQALLDLEIFDELEDILNQALPDRFQTERKRIVSAPSEQTETMDQANGISEWMKNASMVSRGTWAMQTAGSDAVSTDPVLDTAISPTKLKLALVELLKEKSEIMTFIEDLPGALLMHDQRIEILNSLTSEEDVDELTGIRAKVFQDKANALYRAGEYQDAASWYENAIRLSEYLTFDLKQDTYLTLLAHLYGSKGVALYVLSKLDDARILYDKAIEIWKRLVFEKGQKQQLHFLAMTYLNKSVTFCLQHRHEDALGLFDNAIEIWDQLIYQEGRNDLIHFLAMMHMNKANSMIALNNHDQAFHHYDKAIEIWERLVIQEGKIEAAPELAKLYVNKSSGLNELKMHEQALSLLKKAVNILEQRVIRDGRVDLSHNLASSYLSMGETLFSLKDTAGAYDWISRAVQIYERLVIQEKRMERKKNLARCYFKKATVLVTRNQPEKALGLYEKSLEIYKDLVENQDHLELKDKYENCKSEWKKTRSQLKNFKG